MISVLLVDDHELIRQGLRRAVERQEDLRVVGEAGTAAEALALTSDLQPDVVVMDVRLPDGDGMELTRRIRATQPDTGIVVLTMYGGDAALFSALESGASAFLNKDAPAAEVVLAIRHAAAAPTSFASSDLASAMRRRMAEPQAPQLSPRENEVLQLLAQGLPIAALARQMFISESTAKSHVSRLYEKLGATNRAQALMMAVRQGLIDSS